jgi:hypothetical protein
MRFTIPSVAIMITAVLSKPTPAPNTGIYVRDNAEADPVVETTLFAVESPKCQTPQGEKFIQQYTCIAKNFTSLIGLYACLQNNANLASFHSFTNISRRIRSSIFVQLYPCFTCLSTAFPGVNYQHKQRYCKKGTGSRQ